MAAPLVTTPQKFTELDSDQFHEENEKIITDAEVTKREEEKPLTSTFEILQKKEPSLKEDKYYYPSTSYSSAYISFYTAKLIDEVINELSEWKNYGTEESLINISNIKTVLEKNYDYLHDRAENRIFLAYLETIFKDGNWELLTKEQIGFIRNQLNQFKNGEIDFQSLKSFSKKLYSQKLGVDRKKSDEQKTATKEKKV